MGQAKRRGRFEDRFKQAVERDSIAKINARRAAEEKSRRDLVAKHYKRHTRYVGRIWSAGRSKRWRDEQRKKRTMTRSIMLPILVASIGHGLIPNHAFLTESEDDKN